MEPPPKVEAEKEFFITQLCREFLAVGAEVNAAEVGRVRLAAAEQLKAISSNSNHCNLGSLDLCLDVCQAVALQHVDFVSDPIYASIALSILVDLTEGGVRQIDFSDIFKHFCGSCDLPNADILLELYRLAINEAESCIDNTIPASQLIEVLPNLAGALLFTITYALDFQLIEQAWCCIYTLLQFENQPFTDILMSNLDIVYGIRTSLSDGNLLMLIQQGENTGFKWVLACIDIVSYRSCHNQCVCRRWSLREQDTECIDVIIRLLDLTLDKHWGLAILAKGEECMTSQLSQEDYFMLSSVLSRVLIQVLPGFCTALSAENGTATSNVLFRYLLHNAPQLISKQLQVLEECLLYTDPAIIGGTSTLLSILMNIAYEILPFCSEYSHLLFGHASPLPSISFLLHNTDLIKRLSAKYPDADMKYLKSLREFIQCVLIYYGAHCPRDSIAAATAATVALKMNCVIERLTS